MLADIPERKIANIHAMDDKRAGDAQDVGRIVRAEFLILGEDGDPLALKEMVEGGFEQGCGLRRQPDDLIFPRPAPDPDLDLIAFAELAKRLGRPCGPGPRARRIAAHGWSWPVPFQPQYRPWPI